MLVTNQRLDQLAAARIDFTARGMLSTPLYAPHLLPLPPALPIVVLRGDVDNNDDTADGPKVDAAVTLARTRGASLYHSFIT